MSRCKVLLVDDDVDVTDMIRLRLARESIPCDTAASAEAALEMMRQNLYQVVVADIHMPGMNGVQLVAALKQISPLVQVIMLTADASVGRLIEAMDRGAIDFFAKGDFPQMVDPIRQALARANRWARWLGAEKTACVR